MDPLISGLESQAAKPLIRNVVKKLAANAIIDGSAVVAAYLSAHYQIQISPLEIGAAVWSALHSVQHLIVEYFPNSLFAKIMG